MRIVVTGGAGFIGVPLVRRLMQGGHEVRVLTRDPCRAARRLPADCSAHEWLPPARLDALLGGIFDFRHDAIRAIFETPHEEERKAS